LFAKKTRKQNTHNSQRTLYRAEMKAAATNTECTNDKMNRRRLKSTPTDVNGLRRTTQHRQ